MSAGRRSGGSWILPLLLLFVPSTKSGPEALLWIGLQSSFALAIGAWPMLETARSGARAGSLQECSSIGRAPVSKTGGRRFEPCHSCQLNQILKPDFWTMAGDPFRDASQ